MRPIAPLCLVMAAAAAACAAQAARAEAAAPQSVTATWQHHEVSFDYFSITTLYNCDALENQVDRILQLLGARGDLKVRATGCPGLNSPSGSIGVSAQFDVPVEAAPSSVTFPAVWTPFKLTPQEPNFLGAGDCDLLQGLRDLIVKNLHPRDLVYQTSCVPHAVYPDSFQLSGETLKARVP